MYALRYSRFAHHAAFSTLVLSAACFDRAPTGVGPAGTNVNTLLMVSAPSGASVLPSGLRVRVAAARAVQVTSSLVYVSLPPRTVAGGVRATIRDNVNGQYETTIVRDGGFDPVAIAAAAGDQLTVNVYGIGGLLWTTTVKVPQRRPPMIVRTSPPNGKTDVPLNSRVAVVFSEPVDPATVAGSVRLVGGGAVVAGTIALSPPGLLAELVPDSPLMPNTAYELVVTTGVKNLDGDTLQADIRVPFTTGTQSAPTAPLIAFRSNNGIETINPDGSGRQVVIADPTAFEPVWSPDGTKLAFTRTSDGWHSCDIYIARADGSGAGRISTPWTEPWCASTPAWSPDGTRIAFAGGPAGCAFSPQCIGQIIYVVDSDGTDEKQLFTFADINIRPTWSPDGVRLAFECSYFDGRVDQLVGICAGDATGSSGTRLVACCPEAPSWSPDGLQIAYQDNDHPGRAIGLMNADGTNPTDLVAATTLDSTYGEPAWSPDGTRLAFVHGAYIRGADTLTDLYVVNRDGAGLQRLTRTGDVHHPSWSSFIAKTSVGQIVIRRGKETARARPNPKP